MSRKQPKKPEAQTPAEPERPTVFEIRTPSPHFSGERLGVKIVNGVGRTADAALADQLRGLGYLVTP